jgi:hypothetical protein
LLLLFVTADDDDDEHEHRTHINIIINNINHQAFALLALVQARKSAVSDTR